MDTAPVIWLVIGIVVLLVLIGLAVMVMKRRQLTEHRERAAGMRHEAHAGAGGMQESEMQAREARLEADRARAEAKHAEARATEAEKGRLQEEAQYEDQVREADRLDPDVDHRAEDYRPDAPGTTDPRATEPTQQSSTTDTTQQAAEDPVHEPPPGEPGSGTTRRT